jgi:hypothetical protein
MPPETAGPAPLLSVTGYANRRRRSRQNFLENGTEKKKRPPHPGGLRKFWQALQTDHADGCSVNVARVLSRGTFESVPVCPAGASLSPFAGLTKT